MSKAEIAVGFSLFNDGADLALRLDGRDGNVLVVPLGPAEMVALACELATEAQAFCLVEVRRKIRKISIEETQEGAERIFVATVWRSSNEHDMSCFIRRDFFQQLEPLLSSVPDTPG